MMKSQKVLVFLLLQLLWLQLCMIGCIEKPTNHAGRDGKNGAHGKNGRDASACLIQKKTHNQYTISCPQSDPITISDGLDGSPGLEGTDGEACLVTALEEDYYTLTCPNSGEITVRHGQEADTRSHIFFGNITLSSANAFEAFKDKGYTRIVGSINIINSDIEVIDFNFLTDGVSDTISIEDNPQLTTVTLGEITRIHGDLNIKNNPQLTTFLAPLMTQVSTMHITKNETLIHLEFPRLVSIDESCIIFSNDAIMEVSFPELLTAKVLSVYRNYSLYDFDTPQLNHVDKLSFQENYTLPEIHFPKLTIAAESIRIGDYERGDFLNQNLLRIYFPSLTDVNGTFLIFDNPSLHFIDLSSLVVVEGKFMIEANASCNGISYDHIPCSCDFDVIIEADGE